MNIETLAKLSENLWKGMRRSTDLTWNRKRTATYLSTMCGLRLSAHEAGMVLRRVQAEHPDMVNKVPGEVSTFEVAQTPKEFVRCQSTQHCAYHGWCSRCAPQFGAIMSDINRAISDTGAPDTFRGPLYHEIGKTLMPYLIDRK